VLQFVQLLQNEQLSVGFVSDVVRALDDLLLDCELLSGVAWSLHSVGKQNLGVLSTILFVR
jgi:hypothetical protein